MRNVDCGMGNADCGREIRKRFGNESIAERTECGFWNAEYTDFGLQNADFGVKNSHFKENSEKMNPEEMKERTKKFALHVIQLTESLPKGRTANAIGRQLLKCGTSVGANYRAACRAKSPADFVSKMGTVEEETDESLYWMELMIEAGIVESKKLESLTKEADELLAITVASIKTARKIK